MEKLLTIEERNDVTNKYFIWSGVTTNVDDKTCFLCVHNSVHNMVLQKGKDMHCPLLWGWYFRFCQAFGTSIPPTHNTNHSMPFPVPFRVQKYVWTVWNVTDNMNVYPSFQKIAITTGRIFSWFQHVFWLSIAIGISFLLPDLHTFHTWLVANLIEAKNNGCGGVHTPRI